ncbi:hypothetical protein F5J12DRAFT_782065 [Pisolithus orientalis]|uniref:uncharacterized protein n=1 Tax=Pisolithus orientalis TaxID=936130 RepID=UPI0022258EC6|nr:uncharacterized protein F5J12DRAFT_782065 [Pisolithus orientalis]KAI6009557.1 hypothetical protein F5J12DRAFT_782065 [Pisolithus orientalis]
MPATRSSDVTFKVGPPTGAWRSKKVNPTIILPTKAQPSCGAKAHHQVVKWDGEECLNSKSSSVAQHPLLQPCSSCNSSQGLTEKECKDQYLDSFWTKQVALQNDIVAEQGHEKSVTPNDSEEDEQAVESMVQAEGDLVSENLVDDDGCQAVENMMDVMMMLSMKTVIEEEEEEEEEGAADTKGDTDSSVTRRHREAKGKSHALANTSSEDEDGPSDTGDLPDGLEMTGMQGNPKDDIAQALGMHTTQEAQAIADEYGKTLGLIMAAAGLTTEATHAEFVWNMHQAWCHTKNYEDHKDEEEHPQLWAEIWKHWSECVSRSKDISSKAMEQNWCNVEGIHVFGCVIYSGSDEAACQSQGIFAGSSLLMQLNTCPQLSSMYNICHVQLPTDFSVPLPDFNVLSQPHYDHALGLKPQEYRHDCNYAATEENGITEGQRNVSWKSLLDLLYVHQYTITDWPAGVPAVGLDFNVKHLNADELHALTVPFLKESMGADYLAEAPLDDAFVKALPKGDKFKERSAPSSFPDQPV